MTGERMGGIGAVLAEELARAERAGTAGHTVILVEGETDRRAVFALARRTGRDLAEEGTDVVAITGATNIQRFLDVLGPDGYDVDLAGLCDAGEERVFLRSLHNTGLIDRLERSEMERVGFFVCVRDLEDELIRAVSPDSMLELIESQGHLRRFRSFQNQPDQRHKTIDAQILRWLGNHKINYAPLMIDALDLTKVPRPLEGLLASV